MDIEKSEEWKIFTRNVIFLRKKRGLSKKQMANILEIGVESLNR